MWKIIKFLWSNDAAKTLLWDIIRFSKDGYDKYEIALLVESLLAIFKIPIGISHVNNEVRIRFTWK